MSWQFGSSLRLICHDVQGGFSAKEDLGSRWNVCCHRVSVPIPVCLTSLPSLISPLPYLPPFLPSFLLSFLPMLSLELWGYKRVEEIIWVKTNQLQRIIRTGRTGHWLNHSKEHCLVGIKGAPLINRNIDTDVVVAEVRETSRKPDEASRYNSARR